MTNNILTVVLIIALIALYIWMQILSHKESAPSDGGRHKYMYPAPPNDMLFETPPVGSVVIGAWKISNHSKPLYYCKPLTFEGAILISGGSGCGKSTSAVEPYIFNCNHTLRRILHEKKSIK